MPPTQGTIADRSATVASLSKNATPLVLLAPLAEGGDVVYPTPLTTTVSSAGLLPPKKRRVK